MAPFVVHQDTALSAAEAWARVVDWPRHAQFVPFTSIQVTTAPPAGVGTVFVASTGLGRFRFADPMEVVIWEPPQRCRLEKRGRVVLGWAELTVTARDAGARVSWREQAHPARLPALAEPISAAAGRLLFGRVLRGLLTAPARSG